MTEYNFKTDQFGLTMDGLHLLRSGYCYRTLKTSELECIEIKKGIRVKNRALLLTFGLINLIIGLVCFTYILPLNSADGFFIKGAQILWGAIMLILVFLGIALASFYQALIKTTVLIVRAKDYRNVFSLYSTVKNNELDRLINFLKNSPLKSISYINYDVKRQ